MFCNTVYTKLETLNRSDEWVELECLKDVFQFVRLTRLPLGDTYGVFIMNLV